MTNTLIITEETLQKISKSRTFRILASEVMKYSFTEENFEQEIRKNFATSRIEGSAVEKLVIPVLQNFLGCIVQVDEN